MLITRLKLQNWRNFKRIEVDLRDRVLGSIITQQDFVSAVATAHGFSWLYTTPRVVTTPDDLVIDEVALIDYDRLSVAYGLSRLELGRVLKALPMPKLISPPTTSWTDHYISKDLC